MSLGIKSVFWSSGHTDNFEFENTLEQVNFHVTRVWSICVMHYALVACGPTE